MLRRAYAKRRDLNEPEIVEALEKIGCKVKRLDLLCDLIVARRNVVTLLEVKNPERRGDVYEDQQKEDMLDFPIITVTTIEEALDAVTKGRD